ncbi:hypothetical protein A5844_002411 [Enterococcus sp. 10A9_DIV0425]|uniref:Major facilitator superfamily associated domain-containing protein n=1 Tax=Candidatus Enterococcus wittei TaxID=1987383 RepID=A0A242JXH2_9ENTE|nr:MFS transporter [Enterococcus sp. 10A9_DIV0425]OTP09631.1 hypothetical protein A5844_002411 [Enterococcus sp. 10A9_DIV0425]
MLQLRSLLEKMKVKYKFQLIYFVQYGIMAILMTQILPFLTGLGYDSMERGWFLASYSVTTIVFQVVIGYYSDKNNQIKRISMIISLLLGIFSIVFYWLGKELWLLHLMVLAIAGGLANTAATVLDNWVLLEASAAKKLAYIKASGSLGWSMISICIPYLIIRNNYQFLALPLILFLIINVYMSKMISRDQQFQSKPEERKRQKNITIMDVFSLYKNHRFLCYTGLFFLLYLTIVANNTVIIDKLLSMEGGAGLVGLKWAIQSLCEIPAYILLNQMSIKWKNEPLILVAGLFLTIQFAVYFFASTPFVLLAASFLQFFTVPTFTIASRMMIGEVTPRSIFSSGQLISVSFYIGVASFVSPLIGGILSKQLSLDTAIIFFGLLPIVAFLVFHLFRKRLN